MNIRPLGGAELLHVGGRTDRHDEACSCFFFEILQNQIPLDS
jgi:hypothetical protein